MLNLINQINFLSPVIKLWNGDQNSLELVSDSANYVFSFYKSDHKYYLRLTPNEVRAKNQIEAELDFITYLHQGGVHASLPVPSLDEKLIEEIIIGQTLLWACVFEAAEGDSFSYHPANQSKEHFRLIGQTLGQIHALAKKYVPSGDFRRFAWDEDKLLTEAENFLPATETIVWQEFLKSKELLTRYSQSDDTFGLIHGDFGATNYRFRNKQLNVFDFDDSCYHWFLYDLAIAIYPHGWRPEGRQLLNWLLEGYSEKMQLEIKLSDLTMFCQWRLIYMFLVYARKWSFENLTPQQAEWFSQKRENIARGYSWSK